jgi:glycosyltransferase involved in cell wall biosynthesis
MKNSQSENIIIIDADCEYPPEVIPEILDKLKHHDLIYTSRLYQRHSAADANMPYLKMQGNKIISSLFNRLFHQNTSDLYTGCKGFKRHCIEGLDFKHKGFEHVVEFACLLSARNYQIKDIAVTFEPRHTGRSKMSHAAETVKLVYLLLFFRTIGKKSIKSAKPF